MWKQRERDFRHRQVLRENAQEKANAEQIILSSRATARRLARRSQMELTESEEKDMQECQNHKAECEEEIIRENDDKKKSEFVELKLRQMLRENSQELKQLEVKLRSAYTNKELSVQLAEKKANQLAEKYREEVALKLMDKQWAEEEEMAKKRKKCEIERKEQYYRDLQVQEKDREDKRIEAYQDFLREKMMIDEIVQRIHEEDQRAVEEEMLKKKKTKFELDEFRVSQEIWKEKERIAVLEENKRIIEFLRLKEDMEFKMNETVKEREKAKAAITERLRAYIQEKEEKKDKNAEVYQDLLEEELKFREEEKARFELQERLLKREELRLAEAWAHNQQIKKLTEEAQNEYIERKQMLEKLAEDDKLEQLGEERQRKKKAEHRKAVAALLDARQRQRESQMAQLLKERMQEEEEQELRRKAVECERLKMLSEHAIKLIGFLPRGVLREDDLPLLGIESLQITCRKDEG